MKPRGKCYKMPQQTEIKKIGKVCCGLTRTKYTARTNGRHSQTAGANRGMRHVHQRGKFLETESTATLKVLCTTFLYPSPVRLMCVILYVEVEGDKAAIAVKEFRSWQRNLFTNQKFPFQRAAAHHSALAGWLFAGRVKKAHVGYNRSTQAGFRSRGGGICRLYSGHFGRMRTKFTSLYESGRQRLSESNPVLRQLYGWC